MKNLVIVFIGFCFSCTSNESSTSNNLNLDKISQSRSLYERYCLESFWKGYDTLNLKKITDFKNSLMCFRSIPIKFFEMKQLRNVELDTEVNMDTLQSNISNLVFLETLIITKSNLKNLPKEIGTLKRLRKLTIAWGRSLVEVPPEIGNLTNLEELDLFRNNLTNLPKEISNLKKLKLLKLGENNFSDFERNKIVKALPNCKIYFDYLP